MTGIDFILLRLIFLTIIIIIFPFGLADDDKNNNKPTRRDEEEEEKGATAPTFSKLKQYAIKSTRSQEEQECGVYVGLSTLPGTGIGMFAGKNFKKGDEMLPIGDHIIPIIDLALWHEHDDEIDDVDDDYDINNDDDETFFLWQEYTWNAEFFGASRLGVQEVVIASPGFGATANSFMDFVNVEEDEFSDFTVPDNIHRSNDPEAGAFTYFHSRKSYANRNIQQGQEIFVPYGDLWFETRTDAIGPIPIEGDHKRAQKLYETFKTKLLSKYGTNDHQKFRLLEEFWDTFVAGDDANTIWQSSILAALPPKEEYTKMEQIGLVELKRSQMVRSTEWLNKHAVCADNFYFQKSTLHKAGHGVFALRKLKQGEAVLPVPFIHIPDRSILDMYGPKKPKKRSDDDTVKGDDVVRKQLLLNYCLGHANSTMLLSPYGPVFNVINHNQTLANVKLQWALPERSNHHPELLQKNISHFFEIESSKLAMEVITLRDIQPGEEIFLDYGDEWEQSWQEHLLNWKPVKKAEEYISAHQMNHQKFEKNLKTEFEQLTDPYPPNTVTVFNRMFENRAWEGAFQQGLNLTTFYKKKLNEIVRCEILSYRKVKGHMLYTAAILIPDDEGEDETVLIEDMPREAFSFEDRSYTSDLFLDNAFRHDIRIPDDMFPDAWKNV